MLVLDASAGYLDELATLPDGVQLAERAHGHFDVVQAFVRANAEVGRRAPVVVKPGEAASLKLHGAGRKLAPR